MKPKQKNKVKSVKAIKAWALIHKERPEIIASCIYVRKFKPEPMLKFIRVKIKPC